MPADGGFSAEHAKRPVGESALYQRLKVVDPRSLQNVPVPPRVWIVEDWLPVQHVTLSYGMVASAKLCWRTNS